MAFAFRRLTASNSQEIANDAVKYEAIVNSLLSYGTIQAIKTVNSINGEIADYIAYKDPVRGGSLVFKGASDLTETTASDIETNSNLSSGLVTGLVNTNYGDVVTPTFDVYIVYPYDDPKTACDKTTGAAGSSRVFVYKGEIFSDDRGQNFFDGKYAWYFVTDMKSNPTGEVWQIDPKGNVLNIYKCGDGLPPMEEFM